MRNLLPLALATLCLGGCATARDTRLSGGAGIGVVGGAIVAGPIGAVVGGAAGALVADQTRPHGAPVNCHWSDVLQKQVCSYS